MEEMEKEEDGDGNVGDGGGWRRRRKVTKEMKAGEDGYRSDGEGQRR